MAMICDPAWLRTRQVRAIGLDIDPFGRICLPEGMGSYRHRRSQTASLLVTHALGCFSMPPDYGMELMEKNGCEFGTLPKGPEWTFGEICAAAAEIRNAKGKREKYAWDELMEALKTRNIYQLAADVIPHPPTHRILCDLDGDILALPQAVLQALGAEPGSKAYIVKIRRDLYLCGAKALGQYFANVPFIPLEDGEML